jgi:hypothetical protein
MRGIPCGARVSRDHNWNDACLWSLFQSLCASEHRVFFAILLFGRKTKTMRCLIMCGRPRLRGVPARNEMIKDTCVRGESGVVLTTTPPVYNDVYLILPLLSNLSNLVFPNLEIIDPMFSCAFQKELEAALMSWRRPSDPKPPSPPSDFHVPFPTTRHHLINPFGPPHIPLT